MNLLGVNLTNDYIIKIRSSSKSRFTNWIRIILLILIRKCYKDRQTEFFYHIFWWVLEKACTVVSVYKDKRRKTLSLYNNPNKLALIIICMQLRPSNQDYFYKADITAQDVSRTQQKLAENLGQKKSRSRTTLVIRMS